MRTSSGPMRTQQFHSPNQSFLSRYSLVHEPYMVTSRPPRSVPPFSPAGSLIFLLLLLLDIGPWICVRAVFEFGAVEAALKLPALPTRTRPADTLAGVRGMCGTGGSKDLDAPTGVAPFPEKTVNEVATGGPLPDGLSSATTTATPLTSGRVFRTTNWEDFSGKAFESSADQPQHIQSFLSAYGSATTMDSKTQLIRGAVTRIVALDAIRFDTGLSWLKTLCWACQRETDLQDQLLIDTTVNFGLRDLVTRFATLPLTPPASAPRKLAQLDTADGSLLSSALSLQTYRQDVYQEKFHQVPFSVLKESFRGVDWSEEALLPSHGLGNSADINTFKGMIARTPSVSENFKSIAFSKPRWYATWQRGAKFDQAGFIRRLGRQAKRSDPTASAQTKTASIILLWHIRTNSKEALDGLFDGVRFTGKAQTLAHWQIELLVRADTSGRSALLYANDLMLLDTLLRRAHHSTRR